MNGKRHRETRIRTESRLADKGQDKGFGGGYQDASESGPPSPNHGWPVCSETERWGVEPELMHKASSRTCASA
jgi:hypothetical protein